MGPSGCGKSTFGAYLAERLSARFIDADDHHCAANKEKMSAGIGLNDDDREPWLRTLAALLHEAPLTSRIVLGCSALKESYRRLLENGPRRITFVFLRVPREELARRLESRAEHFAGESLLTSQLETLEEPENALILDGTQSVEVLGGHVLQAIESGL